jgi:hypothetical protein
MSFRDENSEARRLEDAAWRRWGPYLSERQWGTVREDYSADGSYWDYFDFDTARSRAYRWGEDGIGGVSDDGQRLCLSLALWNHRDRFLKERLFGLSNREGNHGEDVKECYYHLDALPSHAYLKMLYKYPQCAFPYDRLRAENKLNGIAKDEFELVDTGCFDEDRYFDVFIEYAKAGPNDLLMRVTAHNRGPEMATLDLLPQLWFRNTWSWNGNAIKPSLSQAGPGVIAARHPDLGDYFFYAEGSPPLLFTENDTNTVRLFGFKYAKGYFKDAFHDFVIKNESTSVNPSHTGTRAAAHFSRRVPPGQSVCIRMRLSDRPLDAPFAGYDGTMSDRSAEADAFYRDLPQAQGLTDDERLVQRQALSGMVWNKQFYYYDVWKWLTGDPTQPKPPVQRRHGRNARWQHLENADVILMPDKWEFPWYAAWDLAFHCVAYAQIDPQFAKDQLVLFTGETYMHPNGQLPAYEGEFSHVNPPIHAWAAWRVFEMDREYRGGKPDIAFLERVFHKLLLNFTWWVNRQDEHGLNVFQGGFLGLDNIGVLDRDSTHGPGVHFVQADATSWMGMYSIDMLRIALELAKTDRAYVDIASKFLQHFLHIAKAMHNIGDMGISLWDKEDKFYYDILRVADDETIALKVRSIVGLIPLFAVQTLDPDLYEQIPEFDARTEAFFARRPDLARRVSHPVKSTGRKQHLLALLDETRIRDVLRRALDESEFLSPFGIRGLSRAHKDSPFCVFRNGDRVCIEYEPAESRTEHLGGNSNWRGPVWFPVNFLMIDALREFHRFYGADFTIEYPTGSGRMLTLRAVADELSQRMANLFLRDANGRRAVFGNVDKFQRDPHFRDYINFHEYFDGDTGRGCGASHQSGWTALVANLLRALGRTRSPTARAAPSEKASDPAAPAGARERAVPPGNSQSSRGKDLGDPL